MLAQYQCRSVFRLRLTVGGVHVAPHQRRGFAASDCMRLLCGMQTFFKYNWIVTSADSKNVNRGCRPIGVSSIEGIFNRFSSAMFKHLFPVAAFVHRFEKFYGSDRATRKPKLKSRFTAPNLERLAERNRSAALIHEPPRITRKIQFSDVQAEPNCFVSSGIES